MHNIITKTFHLEQDTIQKAVSVARVKYKKHNGHFTDGQIPFVSCIKIYKYKLTLTRPEAKVQFKLYNSKKLSPTVSTSVHVFLSDKLGKKNHHQLIEEI